MVLRLVRRVAPTGLSIPVKPYKLVVEDVGIWLAKRDLKGDVHQQPAVPPRFANSCSTTTRSDGR